MPKQIYKRIPEGMISIPRATLVLGMSYHRVLRKIAMREIVGGQTDDGVWYVDPRSLPSQAPASARAHRTS